MDFGDVAQLCKRMWTSVRFPRSYCGGSDHVGFLTTLSFSGWGVPRYYHLPVSGIGTPAVPPGTSSPGSPDVCRRTACCTRYLLFFLTNLVTGFPPPKVWCKLFRILEIVKATIFNVADREIVQYQRKFNCNVIFTNGQKHHTCIYGLNW